MIPTRFIFLESLPLNENGKVDRKSLPVRAEVPIERTEGFVKPRNDFERQIAGIWESVLNLRPIGVKDNFFDLGGDSLMAVSMFASVEKLTKIDFPLSILIEAPTVEQFAQKVKQGVVRVMSALVPIHTGGTRPPFFCVHGHCTNVLSFAPLSRELGSDQPFYGLQSIGLAHDQEPLMHIERMAELYLHEIRGVQPHGPYYIGGWCYGGVVAFEMAVQLEAIGEQTALLMLIDNNPSDFSGLVPPHSLTRFRRHLRLERLSLHSAEAIKRGVLQGIVYLSQGVGRKILNMMWKVGIMTHTTLGLPLPRVLQNVQRVNREAFKSYASKKYSGRVTLILPEEKKDMYSRDPLTDWGTMAEGGYSVHYVLGAEGAFFREPNVKALAGKFEVALRESSDLMYPLSPR